MEPRIKSPALTIPTVREAMLAIHKSLDTGVVPRATLELVQVRCGQLNGCSVCVDMHSRLLRRLGESETRICMVSVWRETPYYTEAERAALALAEAATRLTDGGVPDDVWKQAAAHFSEAALGVLVASIASANFWNRLNVTTQQQTGDHVEKYLG